VNTQHCIEAWKQQSDGRWHKIASAALMVKMAFISTRPNPKVFHPALSTGRMARENEFQATMLGMLLPSFSELLYAARLLRYLWSGCWKNAEADSSAMLLLLRRLKVHACSKLSHVSDLCPIAAYQGTQYRQSDQTVSGSQPRWNNFMLKPCAITRVGRLSLISCASQS